MTKHITGMYFDNHVPVVYCKICSAEGDRLLEDCPQAIIMPEKERKHEFCENCGCSDDERC